MLEVVEVDDAPGESGQSIPVVQTRSVGQQPPPRLMGHALYAEPHVRVVCSAVSVRVVVVVVDDGVGVGVVDGVVCCEVVVMTVVVTIVVEELAGLDTIWV